MSNQRPDPNTDPLGYLRFGMPGITDDKFRAYDPTQTGRLNQGPPLTVMGARHIMSVEQVSNGYQATVFSPNGERSEIVVGKVLSEVLEDAQAMATHLSLSQEDKPVALTSDESNWLRTNALARKLQTEVERTRRQMQVRGLIDEMSKQGFAGLVRPEAMGPEPEDTPESELRKMILPPGGY